MKALLFIFFFFISLDVYSLSELYRPKTQYLGLKAYEASFLTSAFLQSGRYDDEGLLTKSTESSYSLINIEGLISYAFAKNAEFFAGGRFRMINAAISDGSTSDGTYSRSGTESGHIGLRYYWKKKKQWGFSADIDFRKSFYTNEEFTSASNIAIEDEIVLGDSGIEVTGIGHLSYKRTPTHTLELAAGYRRSANNLSHEIPYDISSHWHWRKWAFKLGLEGVESLGNDSFTNDKSSKIIQNTGPTNLFNSLNRSYRTPYVGLSYRFESFRVDLIGTQVLSGVSTDLGTGGLLQITWRSRGKTRVDEKLAKFKEYELEASVLRISPRGRFVKIDQGLSSDVTRGMKFDIYQSDFFGGEVLVAIGTIYEVGADWAIIKLDKIVRKISIKKGFSARGY